VLAYKLARLVLAILSPEATLVEAALLGVSWLLQRGPPG
jgi:hypothetical protein